MHRNFKKLPSILLVAVMIFGSAPLAGFVGLELPVLNLFSTKAEAATEYTEGYYTYSVEEGNAKIENVDTSIAGDVTIPSILGGYSVTTIADNAFSTCTYITSITIPNSITSMGDWVFEYCSNLVKITISNSITK